MSKDEEVNFAFALSAASHFFFFLSSTQVRFKIISMSWLGNEMANIWILRKT